jgi:hypothetical protein
MARHVLSWHETPDWWNCRWNHWWQINQTSNGIPPWWVRGWSPSTWSRPKSTVNIFFYGHWWQSDSSSQRMATNGQGTVSRTSPYSCRLWNRSRVHEWKLCCGEKFAGAAVVVSLKIKTEYQELGLSFR